MKTADPLSWTPLLPLAPLQQGMLFHGLREPGSAVYFQQLTVRLSGPLDVALLRQAWQAVLQRHDALRLRVQWQGQGAPGFATGAGELPFTVIDHAGRDAGEHEALRREFLQADRALGFAPDRPPLMRVALLRWSPSCWDLVWSHHHALVDGWSSGLVLAEVVQCYEAALQGQAPALAPASSFRTFLQWLAERDQAAAQRHWQQALAGIGQPTPMPLFKRGGRTGGPGPTLALAAHLGLREAQALARLAAGAGVSAATPVIACWGLLLGRHAGSRDVMFGLTASGRPPQLAGSERMVGLFINTIPLRLDAPRTGSIGEWLGQAQQRLAGALEHQHTALTDIARWSGLPAGQPLFESLVAYENYPLAVAGNRLGPARIERVDLEERPSVPLALLAEPGAGGLSLRLLADSSRIAAADAQSMLDQLHFLLEQVAAGDPADGIARLRLLRPAQRDTILNRWNATGRDYDRDATLPGLFTAQAQRTPAATALIDGAGTLTYGALQRRVEQVAERLALANLPPCSPVGVRLGRSREMVVALLAVGAAGHHYVPIEPALPPARVAAILQALPVRLLLTDGEHLEGTCELAGARAVLQVDEADPADPVDGFACRARPQDPAYVIFTSGSTGRPKGVLVRHTRAVNLIEWVNRRFAVGPADRLLFVTSPAFDLSVYDVFGILAAGGAVRIASEAELADPQQLADLLVNDGITFWDSAPAALWQLAPLLPERPVPAPLRLVFLSGDWVPLPLPERIRQVFPGACVVALGGATEATIWSNYHVVDAVDPGWASVPYGRPIQNARYYVLDEAFEPCPPGVPGDLFIGGECLADGYVGQPELTAERFISDPFCALPGARMYRTGDRARFGADGVMEFLGRVDTQVKVRGFRIELGEIEVALARHPAVREAACVLHDRGQGGPAGGDADPQIVGYYVPRAGHAVTGDALRRHLAQLLPAPMLPALLVALDALPLSANGKVDRKRLPLPQPPAAGGGPSASGDALRDTVAAVWCEVLALDAIGHDDDFFALGGHSLRATSAIARLRVALGTDIPLRLIFEQPTVRGMADALRRLAPGGRPPGEAAAIPRLDPAAGLPLSRAQSRLWFLHQLEPASPQYNVALAARVSGRIAPDLLARALAAVIARHPELDTVIGNREPHPVMLPAGAALPLPFRTIDLSELAPLQREAEALAALTQASRVPFALERERPVRVTLVRTEAGQAYVLILMDHIATDGWSIGLFAQELLAACEADLRDEQLPPPAAPLAAEFAAWWDRHVQDELLPAELAYWRQALAGLQPLALATDQPRPARPSFAGARIHFALEPALSASLRRTAHRHCATLFMLLLAAFDVLLRRRSGRDDFAVGTDIAGRDHPLAERLLGFFVNQLVLRTDFGGAASFADMLGSVRRCALEAFFHQHVPFEALVRELNPVREPGAMPLFQHKFVLQNAPLAALQSRAFQVTPLEIETGTAKYDLLLTVIDEPALRGTLEYSTELFRPDTALALVREFEAVLAQVAADATVSYESLCRLLDADGEERAGTARRELRRSGLQRLRELTRPGAAP